MSATAVAECLRAWRAGELPFETFDDWETIGEMSATAAPWTAEARPAFVTALVDLLIADLLHATNPR
jgi:hypothetical protein